MSRSTFQIWSRLKHHAVGRWLFSRAVCFKAPYFATIHPLIDRLEPGYCELRFSKRRSVTNHIGTIHAIAMCNAAELAAGLATEVTTPPGFRWIPKGMTVSYLKPARTNVTARARCALIDDLTDVSTLQVSVDIYDLSDVPVFHAVIEMYISRRKTN
jgi:acyl-coenzyme A thioesterase PaaI-like protein